MTPWAVQGGTDSFNSRTREGCDQTQRQQSQTVGFQFTHPRGVRSYDAKRIDNFIKFQFTHPRGVRSTKTFWTEPDKVSIHAPARGAINNECDKTQHYKVSIHAPARGAIPYRSNRKPEHAFQFTHPRGVRLVEKTGTPYIVGFNSRTREGCDH